MASSCSTPFGITEYIGMSYEDTVHMPMMCSTPFGITEYIGPWSRDRRVHVLVCSTPFGITEYIGCLRTFSLPIRPVLCSTPFGITEYIGAAGCRPGRAGASVLNAFRHHGVYRRRRRCPCRPCRDVLNAFRHHGVYRTSLASSSGARTKTRVCMDIAAI